MDDYTKWHQSQPDVEAIERIEGRMKAIRVIDIPNNCYACNLNDTTHYCYQADGNIKASTERWDESRPDWCPLIPARGYIDEHGNLVSWEDDSDVD